jgi:Ran GTPase-activating protein (RanGAP) involved in mRNA processing and transport
MAPGAASASAATSVKRLPDKVGGKGVAAGKQKGASGSEATVSRDWLQESLVVALGVPPTTVGKFLSDSARNGPTVTALFLPLGPAQDATGGAQRREELRVLSARQARERVAVLELVARDTSVLRPKPLAFLREQTERKDRLRLGGLTPAPRGSPRLGPNGASPRVKQLLLLAAVGTERGEEDEQAPQPGSASSGSRSESESDESESGSDDSTCADTASTCSSRESLEAICDGAADGAGMAAGICAGGVGEDVRESGVDAYLRACAQLGEHPASFVLDALRNERLDLSQQLIGERGGEALAAALAVNEYVRDLGLAGCGLGVRAARALSGALQASGRLVALDLSGCVLGEAGGCSLGGALAGNAGLARLGLRNARLGDRAVQAVASTLLGGAAPALTTLDLSRNVVGERGAAALAEALTRHRALTHLDLGWNNLGGRGCTLVMTALATAPESRLSALDLSWNGADDACADAAARLIESARALKVLDLSHNRLTVTSATKVASVLRLSRSLRQLQLGFNALGAQGCAALLQALGANEALRLLGVENPLGRDAGGAKMEALFKTARAVLEQRSSFARVQLEHPERFDRTLVWAPTQVDNQISASR